MAQRIIISATAAMASTHASEPTGIRLAHTMPMTTTVQPSGDMNEVKNRLTARLQRRHRRRLSRRLWRADLPDACWPRSFRGFGLRGFRASAALLRSINRRCACAWNAFHAPSDGAGTVSSIRLMASSVVRPVLSAQLTPGPLVVGYSGGLDSHVLLLWLARFVARFPAFSCRRCMCIMA